MTDSPQAQLRREIDQLGRWFGETVRRYAGDAGFELVESVRTLARELTEGNEAAGEGLRELLATLDYRQLKVVIRAFTFFLELANLAEDRQRIRVLKRRERDLYPQPLKESVRDAIGAYHQRGLTPSQVQSLIDRAGIELVLTAHPTEAKRRSVRRILRRLHATLDERDAAELTPSAEEKLTRTIRSQIELMFQTNLLRPWRPTPLQEVERGLAFQVVLWDAAPAVLDDLRRALAEYYPKVKLPATPIIRYGSWIGGDRDGNPFVTPDITRRTLEMLRLATIEKHLLAARMLARTLSISNVITPAPSPLAAALEAANAARPELTGELERIAPQETYRRWLYVVQWRLRRTAQISLDDGAAALPPGAYASANELQADVQLVADSLASTGNQTTVDVEVQPWLDQVRMFGFHTARLDVRQHADVYREAFNELWQARGVHGDPASLEEAERERLLARTLEQAPTVAVGGLSQAPAETFDMFRVLRRAARRFGMAALGEHVISMTKQPSDVLAVLWFWRWSESVDGGEDRDRQMLLPVVPLFETITDLHDAPRTLRVLLETPIYREHVRALGDRQTVMIGYSDSTKDGGYLAAQWALYNVQRELQRAAEEFGVRLVFFHGRGGSLGRGGGPAARGILSLPTMAFSGSLRLTEQGETLAERYDQPKIAHRHLEQVIWSILTAVSRSPQDPPAPWSDLIERLSSESLAAYRQLVDNPAFGEFYRTVTPVDEIERLPIGSRPSKRKASSRIEDLRAIPWVFSWTQCRCLIPAWYGVGAAYEAVTVADAGAAELLATMYRKWSFFAAAIDNAALALAKSNMRMFREYARLGEDRPEFVALGESLTREFDSARRAVLAIAGGRELLDDVPWLQRSIQVRNGYVDPLNMVQAELLQRQARLTGSGDEAALAEIEHMALLTLNGLSAGMRTTG
jgi:phosphoenolpyruvate carboxylase